MSGEIIGNRLSDSTSPYLLQHKDNPVHWLPWGEEAFALARRFERPVLLSSGYAACHWCHVMARESFEDPEIAAIMNAHFVCVKLDREERPDVDRLYMRALHMMGEQGGWPLTMFLTPEGAPFWGGTYFPPEPRYGRPGFRQVLTEIARLWREERAKLLHNARAIESAWRERTGTPARVRQPADFPQRVAAAMVDLFDPALGGIGGAPKFPQWPMLDFLLHVGGEAARHHVCNTLRHIAQGGIYDHLGGGVARYSTDELWLVPHFEKMLYDQALFIDTCATAWLQGNDDLFRLRIEETIAFLERELYVPQAGYAASLDADSDGEEGKFYLWTYDELRRVITPEHFDLFARVYDITPRGNWRGRIILNRRHHPQLLDTRTEAILSRERARLLKARARRSRPARDDKVLAAFNGLAIAAIARAGLALRRADWIALAAQRFREVIATLLIDGTLRQSFNRHPSPAPATADGLANLLRAALLLHAANADAWPLAIAKTLLNELDTHYADESSPLFCYTHDSITDIAVRQKLVEDEATPAFNGIIAECLFWLAHLHESGEYRDKLDRLLDAAAARIARQPTAFTSLLKAQWLRDHAPAAVLAENDDPDSRETSAMLDALFHTLGFIPPLARVRNGTDPTTLPSHLAAAARIHDKPALILCRRQTCSPPAHTAAQITELFATTIE